eukprot:scaffold114219_cov38-Prasinocladus_malaysianus.AAC.1
MQRQEKETRRASAQPLLSKTTHNRPHGSSKGRLYRGWRCLQFCLLLVQNRGSTCRPETPMVGLRVLRVPAMPPEDHDASLSSAAATSSNCDDWADPTRISLRRLDRRLQKRERSLYNCVNSILHDVVFVDEIRRLYPGLPALANLRCGLWCANWILDLLLA